MWCKRNLIPVANRMTEARAALPYQNLQGALPGPPLQLQSPLRLQADNSSLYACIQSISILNGPACLSAIKSPTD